MTERFFPPGIKIAPGGMILREKRTFDVESTWAK